MHMRKYIYIYIYMYINILRFFLFEPHILLHSTPAKGSSFARNLVKHKKQEAGESLTSTKTIRNTKAQIHMGDCTRPRTKKRMQVVVFIIEKHK